MTAALERFLDKWKTHSPNQAAAIYDLLTGSSDAHATAIKFLSRVTAQKTPKKAESSLYGMWSLLTDVAITFPDDQEKLIDLVVAIKACPDYVIGNETAMKWSELPSFDSAMTENIFMRESKSPNEKHLKANINKIAFAARIAARQISGADYTAEAISNRHLNATVPVSAQWIFHAGAVLYNTYDCPYPRMDQGLWDGQPGFTKPRWDFWKERGRWAAELTKLPKDTREVAKKMVEAMDEIENAAE